tara:strand:- start:1775 stop:2671 length:897 start_codon:yes stop_codon:yes gene_type:complete
MPEQPIRYPSDMAIDEDTDYFSITLFDYENPEASGIGNTDFTVEGLFNYYTKEKISYGQTIYLPMPSNLQDSNGVSWGESKMNNLTAAGVVASGKVMDFDLLNPDQSIADIEGKLGQVAGTLSLSEIVELGKKQLAAEAVNILGGNVTIDQLLARSQGQIVNQNNRLLFNGVTLREFNFSFKLTPRNETDTKNVKNIIRALKVHMNARNNNTENSTGTFVKTPGYFDLQYRKGRGKHPFLPSFKECALKNMAVNYTGENVYATYHDGTPVSMQLELSFQEVVPVYAEDYTDGLLGVGY